MRALKPLPRICDPRYEKIIAGENGPRKGVLAEKPFIFTYLHINDALRHRPVTMCGRFRRVLSAFLRILSVFLSPGTPSAKVKVKVKVKARAKVIAFALALALALKCRSSR